MAGPSPASGRASTHDGRASALVTGFGAEEAAADQDAIVAQAVDEELAALEAEMAQGQEEQAELMEQQGDDAEPGNRLAKRARLS